MKRIWKKNAKEAVSPVIATILMVAITVVLAAVLYVMVSGYFIDPNTPLAGSFTQDGNSIPGKGNATLRLAISTPSNPKTANIVTKLFDANNDEVAGVSLTWKHIATGGDKDYYATGDKLQVSYWPTDLSGYKVVMAVDGFAGTIEYSFD